MSKDQALKAKIDELFEATKDLMSLEEIEPYCSNFTEWLEEQYPDPGTRGQELSRAGFYKRFRSIPLHQDKNAGSIPTHDKEGQVKGYKLDHYVIILCGINREQWLKRNSTTRVVGRLGNDREIDPESYLEVTGKLLESLDPHELAVGLIAATGRRPHEILARAKFTSIEGEDYQVMFAGQGKKRGDKPVFSIPTLYPAKYVIKCLSRLRKEPSTVALIGEVTAEYPNDIPAQNSAIDSRRNGSLNRVVRSYFGDVGEESPVLAFRHGEEQDNCKALRAAYGALVTARDCDRSVGSQMLYYARVLGHFVKENPTDKELQAVSTSMGYADYFANKPVPFCQTPQKEKVAQVRVTESDFETIKNYQEQWGLSNQQETVSRLIERSEKLEELGRELLEAKTQIHQLEKEKLAMSQAQTQPGENTDMENLEAKIERLIEEKLNKALSKLSGQPFTQSDNEESTSVVQERVGSSRQKDELTDWSSVSDAELWATKARGASEEKIRRSFEAISIYNNTEATGDGDRLAITNQALRELSGVNGLLVGDWLKAHSDEVISHNAKFGMANKDPQRIDTYYNKRHGAEKISEILGLINEKFLSGEALKSRAK